MLGCLVNYNKENKIVKNTYAATAKLESTNNISYYNKLSPEQIIALELTKKYIDYTNVVLDRNDISNIFEKFYRTAKECK